MLNFMIVVEDGGELKSVGRTEFVLALSDQLKGNPGIDSDLGSGHRDDVAAEVIDAALNKILDDAAIAAGIYDPSDNDTPIMVSLAVNEVD